MQQLDNSSSTERPFRKNTFELKMNYFYNTVNMFKKKLARFIQWLSISIMYSITQRQFYFHHSQTHHFWHQSRNINKVYRKY